MLVKAIRVPSRDQAGPVSSACADVKRTMFVPSDFMTKMSNFVPFLSMRRLSKAIFVPSGDQFGPPSPTDAVVSRVGFAPFASITHTFGPPLRLLEKAIFLPLGDHAGWTSSA